MRAPPRNPSLLVRGALVAGALFVLLLLALQLRGTVYEQRGGEAAARVAVGRDDPALAEQAREDLREARRFRADGDARAREALLLVVSGRPGPAELEARRLVRHEPSNFDGWSVIYLANLGSDPPTARRARRKALALNPTGGSQLDALASLPAVVELRERSSGG